MRVLLAHKLWRVTGGAEVFFRETERVLREAGHETFMVASGTPDGSEPGNLLLLDAPRYASGSLPSRALQLPAAIYDRAKKVRFAEVIREFRPEVMHMFSLNVHLSLSPIDAAAEAGLPIVASFNDYKHICPNYTLFANGGVCFACKGRRFRNAVLKRCCKGSLAWSVASMIEAEVHAARGLYEKIDHFTFASDFMARTTQAFWPERELAWSKLRNPFDSAQVRAREDAEPYALYFGRLVGEKGVDRLLDAAGDVGGYPIRIVGDGPDAERLRARAASEGLGNVEFLGPRWDADLAEVLSRAAFAIVPSLWHENYPYAINQAFAFGRAVIGSDRGGIPEMVEHEVRGLVFEPERPGELAAAIRRLAGDPEAARTMGRAAKQWSDATFDDRTALAALEQAYAAAVNSSTWASTTRSHE
jgi:glycosyltransferase involved in cell wall biosynthesis